MIKDLEYQLEFGEIYIDNEKYKLKLYDLDCLSSYNKQLLEKAWSVIRELVNIDTEPSIYVKSERSKLINEVMKKHNVSKAYVYKQLRKFLQGGKIKVALVSNMDQCGGRDKRRVSDKKLGRPNAISYIDPTKKGVNVTEKDRKIFQKMVKRYRVPGKKCSLNEIYELMLSEEYSEKHWDEGKYSVQPIDAHKVPTFYAFRNWYYHNWKVRDDIIGKYGEREFRLNHDMLTSNTVYHTFGPGHIYEIDATTPGVYLTNRILKDRGIGKAVVYFVIDVFSKLIVGVHVGVGSPSWDGASSALYNCGQDKIEFCKEYGLDITDEQWPNSTLPRRLLADRGELISKEAEKVAENLNIIIDNTPAYMGKSKGNVEQQFHVSESKYMHLVFGAVNSTVRKRGERDYRKDAMLNIEEFTRIILRTVIHHNNKRIENYPMRQGMLDDGVYPTPVNLWNWGIINISGEITSYSDDYIKLNLMRAETATITRQGIRFKGRLYDCEHAYLNDWYVIAGKRGSWKIKIRYDDRNMNTIYLINDINNEFIRAEMKPENEVFIGRTYDEIQDYLQFQKEERILNQNKENKNTVNRVRGIKADIKEARKTVQHNRDNKTMIKDIRENRALEKSLYDPEVALNIKKEESASKTKDQESVEETRDTSRDYIFDIIPD